MQSSPLHRTPALRHDTSCTLGGASEQDRKSAGALNRINRGIRALALELECAKILPIQNVGVTTFDIYLQQFFKSITCDQEELGA